MVYIDVLRPTPRSRNWRWSHGCHLYADSLSELHTFAQRIGMRRSWFQDRPGFPHYDLRNTRRVLAKNMGAVEHTTREMVTWMRQRRVGLAG